MLKRAINRMATWCVAPAIAGVCFLAGGATSAIAQTCEEAKWTLVNEQPRGIGAMAYDSARGVLVCLAGDGATWESEQGGAWVKRATAGPGGRDAMAYDEARGVCVVFSGGQVPDTWEWDGHTWTMVSNSGPSARWGYAMTYDPDLHRVVLFGGELAGPGNYPLGDTWAWNGMSWILLTTQGPTPRFEASLAYDRARGRSVLFGGRTTTSPFELADTWEFDGSSWTRVETSNAPLSRSGHGSAYDAARGVTLVYAGHHQAPFSTLQDTWEWDGVSWVERAQTALPGPRYNVLVTFDASLGQVVMCDGIDDPFGDIFVESLVWGWDGTVWAALRTPPVTPPASAGQMAFDTIRQVAVANLGGQTWEWDGEAWTLRASVGVPEGAMVFDTVRGYTLLQNSAGATFRWDGNNWAPLATGGPAPNDMMAFDSDRGVAVLYAGGTNRDTWEWDGSAWGLVLSLGPIQNPEEPMGPTAGGYVMMTYDSHVHRTIMFGGIGFDEINETWAWDGAEWISVSAGPSPRIHGSMTFDSARGKLVLFGGERFYIGGYEESYGDTWELGDGIWRRVDTSGPGARFSAAITYDAARDNIVLFGGTFGANDTWIRTVREINGGPTINTQPMSHEISVGGWVSFRAAASGEGTLRYQWRRDGEPIQNSARIGGAQTEILSIVDAVIQDTGDYDVVVSNACTSVTSEPATLTITGGCPADFNTDGIANSQDFFDYLNAFFANLPVADFDHSGTIDSSDFFAFLDAFFAGCV